ncbi:phosphatidate cytidylyltransferase [Parasalinivibrio latis]|uniref:phosphatidate cytidylyltransferase n=1 Tax=Parasalinivibrio latis TaxID=2952610 RepID=UPI0030DE48B9
MLKQRVLTALVLAPLVVAGIFYLPPFPFFVALMLVTLLGHWEWTQFIPGDSKIRSLIPQVVALGASAILIPFDVDSINHLAMGSVEIVGAGVAWWLLAAGFVLTYPRSASWWSHSSLLRHLFGIMTLVPFFWSVLILRYAHLPEEPFYGAKLLLLVCLMVWAADSGAYFAGKKFGKRKMAPNVSPNKTVEGLAGGVIAAILVSFGAAEAFNIEFSSAAALGGVTLVTVLASVLGDLAESMFKRVSGVKDSGNILPGHGGILDRIDSLTAAFPVFTLLYFWQM